MDQVTAAIGTWPVRRRRSGPDVVADDPLRLVYTSCVIDGEMSADDVYLGATSVILPGPDPAALLAAVERERATKLFAPPTVWISLLRHENFDRTDLSSLRKGYYGASAKTGGENVTSRVVEQALYPLDGVAEVAVFGIGHPHWIEAVTAFVVPRENVELTAAQVIDHARTRSAGDKCPKYVVFADRLPKNPSGKIVKRELRERHAGLATQD